MRSIFAVGDITEIIPDEEAEIVVLEEPEHLTRYHHGKGWKLKFCLVGVVHANYVEYVKREKNGQIQAFLVKIMNTFQTGKLKLKRLPATVTLISRRSTRRLGTRMWRRGANLQGDAANFIETEQFMEFDGFISSGIIMSKYGSSDVCRQIPSYEFRIDKFKQTY
ncbi:hypothetical protein POM88_044254 [Heracleum sosnowskyi]|uniref:SAC domain-containing protein n=1 Tax=Heracleum sosnowskyi TaxID=360622 RepID=A0AAD8H2G2_9APIA|nr:hypothetical protein POM88_044254 [Heracleum sosnowskyi]